MAKRSGMWGGVWRLLGAAALLVTSSPLAAEHVRHPVFPQQLRGHDVTELMTQVAAALRLSPEQIDAFIVARTCHLNVVCPNCDGGTRQRVGWRWSAEDPERITCGYCGMVFPDSRYPLDKVTTVTDPAGQVQHYPYYEGRDGYKHYLQMHVDYWKKAYMERSAGQLAAAYAATGDERYARQAARILLRLALVYPHYSIHGITDWQTCAPVIYDTQPLPEPADRVQPVPGLAKDLPGYRMPYPYCSTRRGDGIDNWFYDEMCPDLAVAYDQVAGSAALDELSAETGSDARRQVEGFFRATANYTRTFPIYLGNMDPTLIRGLAVIGRVIGEPEFVHDALRRANLILGWQFYADGIWREASPSYHEQVLGGLSRCLGGPLQGYSDPEGYINPIDGTHLTNLDAATDAPMLQEATQALARMCMPNGHPLTIHDAWAQVTLGEPVSPVAEEPLATHLLWAMGQAVLGLGQGARGVQAGLHFSGAYGHEHFDNLDLTLFGCGRELVSDIGYTHTLLRPLAESSLAHNLVVVDGEDQQRAEGHLEAWGVSGDLLRFCEAAAPGAYAQTAEYRRAVVAVALPEGGAYVVDVFRVQGGSQHDWMVHGSADEDQTLDCSIPLEPRAGGFLPATYAGPLPWQGAPGQDFHARVDGVPVLYGLVGDLRVGRGDATWSATFRFAQPDAPLLRTTVLGQPGTTVYAASLPSIRRARESNDRALEARMPLLMVRRTGSTLRSVFTAVHEPCDGSPRLARAEPLVLRGAPDGAVGVVCRGAGFCDYHLFGLDAECRMQGAAEPIRAVGRYAFVRVQGGRVTRMVLVDGTRLSFGTATVRVDAPAAATVVGVRRAEAGDGEDGLEVDAELADGAGQAEERAIVEFGDGTTFGLAVREIRRLGAGQSLVVLQHRPGFTLWPDGAGATHTHHPHRSIPGRPRVRLMGVATWEKRER